MSTPRRSAPKSIGTPTMSISRPTLLAYTRRGGSTAGRQAGWLAGQTKIPRGLQCARSAGPSGLFATALSGDVAGGGGQLVAAWIAARSGCSSADRVPPAVPGQHHVAGDPGHPLGLLARGPGGVCLGFQHANRLANRGSPRRDSVDGPAG